ncbi:MAG: PAS domain-containing sensor histidine kinase [Thermoplasmata archaeon]|nr:MAG: PAS domain-containing sensor histidine kinase [Thermoplasmata archaeon]
MKDDTKPKKQLIKELQEAQKRIVELEASEKERNKVEDAYKTLMTNSIQGVVLIQDGRIVFANLPFLEMSGFKLQELFSFSTDDIKLAIHPEDRKRVWKDLKNRFDGKSAPASHEFRFIRKDESICWVETLVSFVEYRNKPAMQMTFMDVTDQKKAIELLEEEKNRAKKYLDIAGVILVAIDVDQKVTLINKKGCELLGYKEQDIRGKNWFDKFLPKKVRKEVKSVFEQLIKGEIEPVEYYENPVLTKSGKEKVIAWHNTYLKDEAGNITATLSSGEDISERKNIEQSAMEERDRAEFLLDIMGHDINNLNQTVISSSEMLLMTPGLSEKEKKFVQNSLTQARAISELITDAQKILLLRSKGLETEKLDVSKIIDNSVNYIRENYPDRSIDTNSTLPESEIVINCNSLLQDVFDNILVNAVKYNRNEKVNIDITHSSTKDGKYWKLEFKDNGPGIPDEMKTQIFKGLKRDDYVIYGSRFGLIFVQEVLRQYGGKVWVEDRVKDDSEKGSNFVVLLPRED